MKDIIKRLEDIKKTLDNNSIEVNTACRISSNELNKIIPELKKIKKSIEILKELSK